MGISIKQFIDKTYKTKVDVPWGINVLGDLAGQCVSLAQQYVHQVYDVPLKRRGDAKDYGYNLIKEGHAKEISYSQLRYGDIIVWGANQGGGYGHIAIYIQPGLIYDQNNYSVKPVMEAQYRPIFGGAIQYLRMNKQAPTDTVQEIAESYAFINKSKGLRLRERPSLNAKIVGELKVDERYEYDKKATNDGYTWVSNGKNWVAFRDHSDNSTFGDLTPKLEASKPTPPKETIYQNFNGYKVGDLIEFSQMYTNHHLETLSNNAKRNSLGRQYGYIIHLYPLDNNPLAVAQTKGGKQIGGVRPVNVYRKNQDVILK